MMELIHLKRPWGLGSPSKTETKMTYILANSNNEDVNLQEQFELKIQKAQELAL